MKFWNDIKKKTPGQWDVVLGCQERFGRVTALCVVEYKDGKFFDQCGNEHEVQYWASIPEYPER